jgi:hypothetical protein
MASVGDGDMKRGREVADAPSRMPLPDFDHSVQQKTQEKEEDVLVGDGGERVMLAEGHGTGT